MKRKCYGCNCEFTPVTNFVFYCDVCLDKRIYSLADRKEFLSSLKEKEMYEIEVEENGKKNY